MALEAYDFSLFQERAGNAAPAEEPNVVEQPRRQGGQVVEIPGREAPGRKGPVKIPERKPQGEPKTRRRYSPVKMAAAAVLFVAIFSLGLSVVYSQVVLTELTETITDTSTQLEEARSREVQLSMQAAQRMTDAEVEKYATEKGMSKLTGAQVTYLHVTREDQGKVVQDIEGGSFLDKLFAEIRAWLAG